MKFMMRTLERWHAKVRNFGMATAGMAGALVVIASLGGCAANTPPANDLARTAVNFKMGAETRTREPRIVIVTMRNLDHFALVGTGSVAASPSTQPVHYRSLMTRWQQSYGLSRVADWPLSSLDVRCMVFELNAQRNLQETLTALRAEPLVETAQPLQSFRTVATAYNDPYSKLQHGLSSLDIAPTHQWATGKGVKVAVVDTGLDADHAEISGRVPVKRNLVNGNLSDFNRDVHGTAVAGVIAASANNRNGIVGVAPDASIMAMKACWQTQPGYDAGLCNSFTLAKAINASIAARADIINLSLAGPNDDLLHRLLRQAIERRIIVVGAVDEKRPNSFPASTPGVIAVAVHSKPSTDGHARIAGNKTLQAPGRQVVSIRPGNQYDMFNGSSIAAAHISGLAAMIKQHLPELTADRLSEVLHSSIDPASGMTNVCRAVTRLLDASPDDCRQ